jgi:Tfp pilus assembly protein PilE
LIAMVMRGMTVVMMMVVVIMVVSFTFLIANQSHINWYVPD